jgi:site-specific recombinase XerD
MPTTTPLPCIAAFLDHLRVAGRLGTAGSYGISLGKFQAWCSTRDLDPLRLGTEHLRAFQGWLAEDYRTPAGARLGRAAQGAVIAAVKTFYRWMARRGLVLVDIAKPLRAPAIPVSRTVHTDHLTLQEVTALLLTRAAAVAALPRATRRWAVTLRDLAMLCTAVASGRRREGICDLTLADVDGARGELRCAWEKGKAGRVLPLAGWAMAILTSYIHEARPILVRGRQVDWLFVGQVSGRIGYATYATMLTRAVADTCARNPDLEDLPHKRITTHSLRVSFATLLFSGGCSIRSINELLMHSNLTTTARYTPIPLEDLRRVFRTAHPRA